MKSGCLPLEVLLLSLQASVETLIIHGDSDRTLPLPVSGQASHELIKGSRLVGRKKRTTRSYLDTWRGS
jgi:predicted esterase